VLASRDRCRSRPDRAAAPGRRPCRRGADAILFEKPSATSRGAPGGPGGAIDGLPVVVSFTFDSGKDEDRTMTGPLPRPSVGRWPRRGRRRGGQLRRGPEAFPRVLPPAEGARPAGLDQAQRRPARAGSRPRDYSMQPSDFRWPSPRPGRGRGLVRRRCCGTSPEFVRALARALQACSSS